MIAALFCLSLGAYGLSDPSPLGPIGLAVGVAFCFAGLAVGRHRVGHTKYRPDRWRGAEWLVVVSGVVPLVVFIANPGGDPTSLNPSFSPVMWPSLPLWPTIALLVAALPAIGTPPPTSSKAPQSREDRSTTGAAGPVHEKPRQRSGVPA